MLDFELHIFLYARLSSLDTQTYTTVRGRSLSTRSAQLPPVALRRKCCSIAFIDVFGF